MNDISISRRGLGQFKVGWPGVSGSAMLIDFRPLMDAFGLSAGDDFVLIHWQAQPKGLRQWGLYSGKTDSYVSDRGGDLPTGYDWERVQLDERAISTKPTAVLVGRKTNETNRRRDQASE